MVSMLASSAVDGGFER